MSASSIPSPGNSSDIDTSSLIPINNCTEESNNAICEAIDCKKKAEYLIRAKAGQHYIPLKLCELHKYICVQ